MLHVIGAKGLVGMDVNLFGRSKLSDPYCVVSINSEQYSVRTKVIDKTLSPVWDETFRIDLKFPEPKIVLTLFDRDKTSRDDYLGRVFIDTHQIASGQFFSGWLPIKNEEKGEAGMIKISLALHYTNMSYLTGFIRKRSLGGSERVSAVSFDIRELYVCIIIIYDIAISRTVMPLIKMVLSLLRWDNPYLSVAVLLLWYPIVTYNRLWPTMLCILMFALLKHNRRHADEATLSQEAMKKRIKLGTVITTLAGHLSTELRGDLAGLRVPFRQTATLLIDLWEISHAKHRMHYIVTRCFFVCVLVFLFIPFTWLIYTVGVLVLVVISPLSDAILGAVDFASRAKPIGYLPGLREEFDPHLLSVDARVMKK